MRILSNTQSVAARQLTLVALVESIAAVSVSLWLAIKFGTLAHVATGACLAPLLLMRSRESVERGQRWFARIAPTAPTDDDPTKHAWVFLRILAYSFVVRVLATARHPIKGIRAIPENWTRVVLCTDIRTPLELVPGCGTVAETLRESAFDKDSSSWGFLLFSTAICGLIAAAIDTWARDWTANVPWHVFTWILEAIFLISTLLFGIGLMCYVIAYVYRFSLKSTAVIWLPIIYVVRAGYDESLPLLLRLKEIQVSAIWNLIRAISWITILLLACKIILLPNAIDWWNSHSWAEILNVYVMPNRIHPWHVAAGLNSLIALLGYYYFLERAPRLIKAGAWSEGSITTGLRVFTFTRGVISIYTIAVGIYLTVVAALSMKWPQWSWNVVPW